MKVKIFLKTNEKVYALCFSATGFFAKHDIIDSEHTKDVEVTFFNVDNNDILSMELNSNFIFREVFCVEDGTGCADVTAFRLENIDGEESDETKKINRITALCDDECVFEWVRGD